MRAFLLLVASVLASIGVGVGVEAAIRPSLYGPPGGQFTAAFPSAPTVTTPKTRAHVVPTYTYAAGDSSTQLTVAVTVAGSGWTGYAPLNAGYRSVAAIAFSTNRKKGFPRHLPLRPARVDGERVELGIACGGGTACVGVLFGLARNVDDHLVEWSATALARSASSARALVTSLRPVVGVVPSPARS